MAATTTMKAADFLSGIGVDTHIPYTDGGYVNLANVQADLNYIGVTELRDGITDGEYGSAPLASYIQLAKAGEKFTFVVGGGASTDASIQYTLGKIAQLAAAVPGSVRAVEGPNEINNQTLTFNGVGGLQGAVALQQYLYNAVKSTPALSSVAVDYFTGYDTVGFAAGPDPSTTAGLADYDTQHPYPQSGQAPGAWVNPSTALGNEPGVKGAFVYTETGYTTDASSRDGVDAVVQGKYTLDLLMDAAKDGSSGTYLYQLMDAYKPGSPQGDDGYGLFDENNDPKPAATGLHDLAAILADTGATASSFTPTALAYTVSGLPATGNTLEISKSDGATDIVVWAEPEIWNQGTGGETAAPTETVTVSLGAPHAVSVYDPLVGTAPIATFANVSAIPLQVTDHPLVIEVEPITANAGAVSTKAVAPAVTSGSPNIVTPPSTAAAPAPATPLPSTVAASAPATPLPSTAAAPAPSTPLPSTIATPVSAIPVGTATTTAVTADTVSPASTPAVDQTAIAQVASPPAPGASPTITDPLANTTVTDLPVMAVTTIHDDGTSTVDLKGGGQTVSANWHDTFLNHGMAGNTFVFASGYERDVVKMFRVSGDDHDVINLQGTDFSNSLSEVIRNTTMVHGNAVITDPMTGDTVKLVGITKSQLAHNQRDFSFHT